MSKNSAQQPLGSVHFARASWAMLCSMALFTGCGEKSPPSRFQVEGPLKIVEVKTPEKLTLYSIDGTRGEYESRKIPAETRLGVYPILGEVEITEPAQRNILLAAVQTGIASVNPEYVAPACFWPRHALRTEEEGQQVTYIICFACDQVRIDRGEKDEGYAITTDYAKDLFNSTLKAAGIPLAQGAE